MNHDEAKFLNSVTHTYVTSESSQDRWIKALAVDTFVPFITPGGTALELGCCDGFMTSLIAPHVSNLDVVDGSSHFLEATKKRGLPNVRCHLSLFEDFQSDRKYDYIFATYVLEHVLDAQQLLALVRSLLKPNGMFFVVVPNCNALSRQLAKHMGLIEELTHLTPNDINHGHRRVYDRVSLNRELAKAGLRQIAQGGLLLKPLADFQMEKLIDLGILGESQMHGLYKLGLEYPDFAGSLFSVCRV